MVSEPRREQLRAQTEHLKAYRQWVADDLGAAIAAAVMEHMLGASVTTGDAPEKNEGGPWTLSIEEVRLQVHIVTRHEGLPVRTALRCYLQRVESAVSTRLKFPVSVRWNGGRLIEVKHGRSEASEAQ